MGSQYPKKYLMKFWKKLHCYSCLHNGGASLLMSHTSSLSCVCCWHRNSSRYCTPVQAFACRKNSALWFINCWATTASWGSSGCGHSKRTCKLSNAVLIPSAGDHWSFRMSRQIAPVWLDMLGCQTLVMNFIFGGSYGYWSLRSMPMRNVPPSYGESFGPAWQR